MKINVRIQSLRERNVTNPGCTKHCWQCVVAFMNIANSKCAVWKPFELNWITGNFVSVLRRRHLIWQTTQCWLSQRGKTCSMPHHGETDQRQKRSKPFPNTDEYCSGFWWFAGQLHWQRDRLLPFSMAAHTLKKFQGLCQLVSSG